MLRNENGIFHISFTPAVKLFTVYYFSLFARQLIYLTLSYPLPYWYYHCLIVHFTRWDLTCCCYSVVLQWLQKLNRRQCPVSFLKQPMLSVELILRSGCRQWKALLYCMSCWKFRTRNLEPHLINIYFGCS